MLNFRSCWIKLSGIPAKLRPSDACINSSKRPALLFSAKEKAISLGNLIGSNMFNILAVLGITSMITPVEVKPEDISLLNNDIYWMLAYLNSALVTYMVRGILIRSNMITSGYVSQIPIPDFDTETKAKLGAISKNIIENKIRKGLDEKLGQINEIIFDALSISPKTREMILNFSNTLSISV